MKVAILHQGCVPTYRKPFFEKLGPGYVVFAGESLEGIATAKPPYAFSLVQVHNRRLWGNAIYQSVFWKVASGNYDAIVIGHEAKYVANFALAAWFRLRGRPVILWGFGRNVKGPAWLQRILLLLATDYLAYTAGSANQVPMALDRVTVLHNTIDMEPEIKAHAEAALLDREALRRELSIAPGSVVFLFLGRALPEKRADLLVEAVHTLRKEGLPVEYRVVTEIYDRDQLARIFRAVDALVIPGYVGLVVNHAFAHGLPVITCRSPYHSPEIEYVQHGVNGLILDELVPGLREFATSPTLRAGLSEKALATRDNLSLGRMVSAFEFGVNRAVSRPRSRMWFGHLLLNILSLPLVLVLTVFLFLTIRKEGSDD